MNRNFGDPAGEYNAAHTGAVVHTRTDRSLLRVYGRDPQRIVQGIVTNDVVNVPPDRIPYAAMLTPKGRMVADVRIMRHGDDLLLDVPSLALDDLLALFRRTIPPLFAKFEDITATRAMLGVYGPTSRATVEKALGNELPELPSCDGYALLGGVHILTTLDAGVPGVELVVPAEAASDIRSEIVKAGALEAGDATIEVLRIEAGTPRWGADLDETTIPLEAGLRERAISTGKGCYTGQEVIIRVLHRGHVNWHLRGALLGDAATPSRGTQLIAAETGRVAGRVTSAAWSPLMNQTIALAYVRREVEPPAELRVADAAGEAVTVVTLPFVA